MAEYLLSMEEAFKRFLPGVRDVAARAMAFSGLDQFKAGIVEGDLVIDREGLVLTSEMVPAFHDAPLGALFITGSLRAPKATIAEPDIDWSPLLKIKGNVVAKNLCLGGSASEIDGDVTVSGVLMGYYNHGQMRIRGKTRAPLVLVSDYEFIFEGAVERKYVASWGGRLNIPVDYDRDHLDRILAPEVIDETNFIHDGVILDRLSRGLADSSPRRRDRHAGAAASVGQGRRASGGTARAKGARRDDRQGRSQGVRTAVRSGPVARIQRRAGAGAYKQSRQETAKLDR